MKKVIFLFLAFSISIYAKMLTQDVTSKVVNSGITIIDIRTKPEWKDTGVVKNSIPITFFDEHGNYDAKAFIKAITPYVNKDKKFALICRTGRRTDIVADFLGNKLGYNVISLKGGVNKLIKDGYKLVPYDK